MPKPFTKHDARSRMAKAQLGSLEPGRVTVEYLDELIGLLGLFQRRLEDERAKRREREELSAWNRRLNVWTHRLEILGGGE